MEEKTEKKNENQERNLETKKTKNQKEGRTQSVERVALKDETYARTEMWLSQIDKQHPGVRINRNDLVNFILLQHPPTLSEDELSVIGKAHYNELRFYTWALKTVRQAQARGEDLTVEKLKKRYGIPE